MRRRFRAVVLALVAILGLGGCGGGGGGDKDDNADPSSVRIVDFEFKPKTVTVKPGTKVTWKNDDTNIHDVKDTSPLATPVSQEMSKGDTFSITYAQPGSYTYVCGIHPYMTGTVEVVP